MVLLFIVSAGMIASMRCAREEALNALTTALAIMFIVTRLLIFAKPCVGGRYRNADIEKFPVLLGPILNVMIMTVIGMTRVMSGMV